MDIKRSDRIGSRVDLAHELNRMNLTRLAVEVGTDRGVFASQFIRTWIGEMLYCVDHWQPYTEMPYDRTGDLMLAAASLAPYAGRVKLIRADSREAAGWLHQPHKFQFVYVDGAHDFDSVTADLEAWWPRVAAPGIFAGHDIDLPEVQEAVKSFAEKNNLVVEMTSDYWSPSWFIRRPPES